MVRTEVGLKCERCAEPVAEPLAARAVAYRRPILLGLAGLAVLAVVAVLLVLGPGGDDREAAAPLPPVGTWSKGPDLAAIRGTATAVVLDDGSALVAGGGVGAIPLDATEVLRPDAEAWETTGTLTQARRGHRAALLDDGRVVVAGGLAGSELLATAEIYDPATGDWAPTGAMATPRLGHSLTSLADGRVLAIGGDSPEGTEAAAGGQTIRPTASTEIYDPATGAWAPGPSMATARFEHTATPLTDGRVLVTGGLGPVDGTVAPLASTEVYDPAANAFVSSTDLNEGRTNHASVRLGDGSVLVAGGAGGANGDLALASAEVFDPGRGTWTAVSSLASPRSGETATLLDDGRVLVAGGEAVSRGTRRSLASAEVFDPSTRRWRSGGEMSCFRSEQDAARLGDGSVLVVAGDATFPGKAPIAQSCADRYRP
ncbi:MAG: Kelch repeat-containing protein [Acidimicrobiales bacterium]